YEEITKDIIGAAMAVLNELRPGLDERLYENALLLELLAHGHTVEQQREYPVFFFSSAKSAKSVVKNSGPELNPFADHEFHEVGDAAAIAPFVVVPTHEFEET